MERNLVVKYVSHVPRKAAIVLYVPVQAGDFIKLLLQVFILTKWKKWDLIGFLMYFKIKME